MISEDEYLAWKRSEVTQWVLGILNKYREELKEDWALDGSEAELQVRAMVYGEILSADHNYWIELEKSFDE